MKTSPLVVSGEFQIQTFNSVFDYEDPEKSTVSLEELAGCLSNICRWGGWCKPWFSVAQHACLVFDIAYEETHDPLVGLYSLHHDDHEGFRGDIPSPRKRYLKRHGQLFKGEQIIQDEWIYRKLLGLEYPVPESIEKVVKWADQVALHTEKKFIKPPSVWGKFESSVKPLSKRRFDTFLLPLDWAEEFMFIHKEMSKEAGK